MTKQQEELVNKNINLVYKITSGFRVPPRDRKDLIQEGFMALCMAAQRFDPTRGDKFITYAYSYVCGRCKYFVSRNAVIKPARTKESGYKQFCTYETPSLDDYMYMADPNSNIEITEIDGIADAIREEHGEQAAQVVVLCGQGFTVREIAKQLNIKQAKVNEIYALLKDNEIINKILRSTYGTSNSTTAEKKGSSTEKSGNDGSTTEADY